MPSIGAGARISLTPRISVGPEFAYMVGPDADRDIFVLGSMWIDLLRPGPARPVAPYVVFGGGYMSHRDELGRGPYPWKHEGSFTAGGGARVRRHRSRLRRRRRQARLGAAPAGRRARRA